MAIFVAGNYGMNKSKDEKFSLTRAVALIGMMGAGKTSVGRALAELVGAPFYDADVEIEAAAGCSIPDIFARYGEAEFRRLERQVVGRLLGASCCVLSLGGGAFMDAQTRARIQDNALSLWIKVEPAVLLQRVSRNANRPLLQGGDVREKLTRLLAERGPVYAQADLTVCCPDAPVFENARRLRDALQAAQVLRTG